MLSESSRPKQPQHTDVCCGTTADRPHTEGWGLENPDRGVVTQMTLATGGIMTKRDRLLFVLWHDFLLLFSKKHLDENLKEEGEIQK